MPSTVVYRRIDASGNDPSLDSQASACYQLAHHESLTVDQLETDITSESWSLGGALGKIIAVAVQGDVKTLITESPSRLSPDVVVRQRIEDTLKANGVAVLYATQQ